MPSAETQDWLALCRSSHWLLTTAGVVRLEGGFRGIPLAENAPEEADTLLGRTFAHRGGRERARGPYTGRNACLEALQQLPPDTWPSAYEIQGDVLIVKLEGTGIASRRTHRSGHVGTAA